MSGKRERQHERTAPAAPGTLSRRAWIGLAAGGAVAALSVERLWAAFAGKGPSGVKTAIQVYASPTCGCCEKWGRYLGDNEFDVKTDLIADVTPIKTRHGVPEALWSCHTALVGGYVVEGHVPADLIRKVLKERPAIVGLAAPGMPNSAPGMDGAPERYEVLAFTKDGASQVYAVRS